ncbi:MAG: hypothetical protein WCP16_13595 [Pseudanabaena sp. ELA645]|jgi:hypothetical protein
MISIIPMGAVVIFYSLTATDTHSYRLKLARKTSLNVILVLVTFFLSDRLLSLEPDTNTFCNVINQIIYKSIVGLHIVNEVSGKAYLIKSNYK